MRRVAVLIHLVLAVLGLAAAVGMAGVFWKFRDGSFWGGTLHAWVYGYHIPAVNLIGALVVGGAVFLLSGGRLLQLLWPGMPLLRRWTGLRSSANSVALIILLVLVLEAPDINPLADVVRAGLRRVAPGLVAESAAEKPQLPSDSEIGLPALPVVREEDPLKTVSITPLDGAPVTLGDLRGKAVFLNVWATWCGPCRAEMPNIEALYQSVKDEPNVAVVLASIEPAEKVRDFLKTNPHEAPIYVIEGDDVRKLGVNAFPTTLILSPGGEVLFRKSGYAAWDGGATRAFLLSAANGLPFTPPKPAPKVVESGDGRVFEETIVSADKGVMDLARGGDGTVYYADFFGGTVGRLNTEDGTLSPLFSGLASPHAAAVAGDRLYFLESGTEEAKFKDGRLGRITLSTGIRETLLEGLEYPVSLVVDAAENAFILEAAGSSTVFGGKNRLSVLKQGQTAPETLLDGLPAPEAFLLDDDGGILVGTMGRSSPGDTGTVMRFEKGAKEGEVIAKNLPTVQDMAFDTEGNILLAGYSEQREKSGILLLRKGAHKPVVLRGGFGVNCLCPDPDGGILYSTGMGQNSLRLLRPKN
jgi:thiol-disulfide isomerase/thioredoxin/sugar lactone lactonase YvrE